MEMELRRQGSLIDSLQETNAVYATILENIDGIIYVCDMDHHEILYINDTARELFGSVEGKTCWQIFQKQQGPCDFCTNKMLVNSDGSICGQYVWEHRNPYTCRWYKLYDQAIKWHDGRLVRLEIAFDITEQKEAQLCLANREALLETVSSAAQQFLSTSKWEGAVTEILGQLGQAISVSRVTLFRYAIGASGEKDITAQCGWAAPGVPSIADGPSLQDCGHFAAEIDLLSQVFESGEPFSLDPGIFNRDEKSPCESLQPRSAFFLPIMIDGLAWGVVCLEDFDKERTWTDVEKRTLGTTASLLGCAIKRQQAEYLLNGERLFYRAVLNDQSELVCRYQPGGILSFVNTAFCRFFGKKEEDLIGSSFFELFPEKERIRVRNHVAALTAENPVTTMVIGVTADNGEFGWYHWTERMFYDDRGNATGYQATGRDVTSEKKEKEDLRRNQETLEILIQKRTVELTQINRQLKVEIGERQRAARELEEANIALRVLLQQSAGAKKELEEKVHANINKLIYPYLDELGIHLKERRELSYLEMIKKNLQQITSSFSHKIKTCHFPLTPRETQVADLIRQGRTNKEIAEILFLSPRTVETYRDKLRKKLGLRNKKVNLSSFLNTL